MGAILQPAAVVTIVATVAFILRALWQRHAEEQRAKQWGCKPAFVRPYRLPFGIDILKRYIDSNRNNEAQIDDQRLFEELGRLPTWYQQVLGNWHYFTNDPKNIQALLATQFKDFELGALRRNCFGPFLGEGIFTSDGKQWEHDRAMLRPQFTRSQVSKLDLEETHVQALFNRIPSSADQWTEPIDLGPMFFHLTLDSATEFLFGESVNSQSLQHEVRNEKGLRNTPELDWSSFGQHFDDANMGVFYRYRLFDLYFLYNPKSFRDSCAQVHKCVDYFVNQALSKDVSAEKDKHYVFLYELAKSIRDRCRAISDCLGCSVRAEHLGSPGRIRCSTISIRACRHRKDMS